jgi:signal transduction histidine kinase
MDLNRARSRPGAESNGVRMNVAVLPRAVAAAIINTAFSRAGWALAATTLLLDVPGLLSVFARRGLEDQLLVPLLALMLMLIVLALAVLRPTTWAVLLYLLVGGGCVVVYQLAILVADPGLQTDATYLLNRPAIALLLVSAASASSLLNILWSVLGYALALAASCLAAVIAGRPIVLGWGPTLAFLAYVTACLALTVIQKRQRRVVPDFGPLERQTRRLSAERELTRRTVAVVHDTVLNDLAFVMSAPDNLNERYRQQLRDDVATLTSAAWLRQARTVTTFDLTDALTWNHLETVVSEMQWRGLTVHLSGNRSAVLRSSATAAAAGVDAARACLENVLDHSGVTVAEIVVGQEAGESTIMVVDEGRGFDPRAVPADRLGLRVSVEERIKAVGGYVRIWSTPGNGTSVLISVPAFDVADGGSDDDD